MKKNTQPMTTNENLPAVNDYGDDAGTGFEGTTGSDLSIPFLNLLQANSPHVVENNPPGARAGMLYNSVTGELIAGDVGAVITPVHKQLYYIEWIPRDNGGGFVQVHEANSPTVQAAIAAKGSRMGKIALSNGNELVETHCVYALTLNDDGTESTGFTALSFTSTKIKPCRNWFTALYMLKGRPPLFANRARLKTVLQKNRQGQPYFNFTISPFGASWLDSLISPKTQPDLLAAGKHLREMIAAGAARANFEGAEPGGGANGAAETDADGETAPPF